MLASINAMEVMLSFCCSCCDNWLLFVVVAGVEQEEIVSGLDPIKDMQAGLYMLLLLLLFLMVVLDTKEALLDWTPIKPIQIRLLSLLLFSS